MTVLERFLKGDVRALSRIVSYVENRENGYQDLLGRLYEYAGHSLRIGLTGPPGAGKSTLVNGLTRMFLADGKKVGMIAVDPTSPFTGGALLGDRVRVQDLPMDGSAYFRSMATRGASGGLASATNNVAVVYDAFGFDVTLIETVGVGQVELDVIDSCDTVVVVIVPESGDAVQTFKAGLMEIADIFCINKADRPGADRLAADLKQMLDTRRTIEGAWPIPILSTQATNRGNIDKLYQQVAEHVAFCRKSGRFEKHRHTQLRKKILAILKNRFQQEFIDSLADESELDAAVQTIVDGESNPYAVGDLLYRRFSR
ncbi:MAG: methylmalonyl Co-A mutase-associated GTPase MeaB [candidate division Zixibacteria bacterium]|nr:methylmalonyl Co-A mutase-associated GTPase MeaB [candidate division Zixibacteria bacterium]